MSSQIIPRWWLLLLITYVINAEAVIRDSNREVSTLLRGAISQELSNLHTLLEDTVLIRKEKEHELEAIRKQKQQLQEQVHLRKERRRLLSVDIDKLKSMLEWNEDVTPREPLITSQLL